MEQWRCLLLQQRLLLIGAVAVLGLAAAATCAVTPITVDFAHSMDVPLLKKYAVYNSGIIPQERYTPEVLASMGLIKAAALRIDLSVGKDGSGFTDLMSGEFQPQHFEMNFNFSMIDTLAEGLQAQKVMPYWGLSYNPMPFQPACTGGPFSVNCTGSNATCLGFEDQAAVAGSNNYTCLPYGSSAVDDCWKCPPKTADDQSYNNWSQMLAYFHNHFVQKGITPLYEEHWNEPDLTEYYNPTLAAYKGSSQDYIDSYSASATAMLAVDADLVFGGMSVANQITHNPKYPKQPNNEDTLLAAAENGFLMEFFSYHSITTTPGMDQTQLVVNRTQLSREVLSSTQLVNLTGPLNHFETTEVHCSEYFPNSTTATLTSAFSSSAYLATLLLDVWHLLLDETDLTMVHWAQYMDIFGTPDQIGLIDFWGNPRPAWWAFRWYSELPVERVHLELDSPYVRAIAAFSPRQCAGGVLMWNVPTPQNNDSPQETEVTVTLKNVPLVRFNVEAYIIDDRKQPTGGFVYAPSVIYPNQTADANGEYLFPWASYAGLKVPVNATVYLKLVPLEACPPISNAANNLPTAQILRSHYYFGFRPRATSLYAHFHQRDWTAYLGMGGEASGFAITGATIRVPTSRGGKAATFNISMSSFDGEIAAGGIAGVRMDLSSTVTNNSLGTYQQSASYFFYQAGTAPCIQGVAAAGGALPPPPPPSLDLSAAAAAGAPTPQGISQLNPVQQPTPSGNYLFASQNSLSNGLAGRRMLQAPPLAACGLGEDSYVQIPDLWGTKQPVWADNFIPVDLTNFTITPASLAPAGFDGRVMLLFVMKDGTPGTKVQAYITRQPGSL